MTSFVSVMGIGQVICLLIDDRAHSESDRGFLGDLIDLVSHRGFDANRAKHLKAALISCDNFF